MQKIYKSEYHLFTIAYLFLVLIHGCSGPKMEKDLNSLQWLTGRWENENEGRKTVEVWSRENDKSYRIKGFMLEGTDTIFTENITVKPVKNHIDYTVVIADQNNGQPVSFKLTRNTGSEAVFENPAHDFPQKIRYIRLAPDSVKVQIAGKVKGKPVSEAYIMQKK